MVRSGALLLSGLVIALAPAARAADEPKDIIEKAIKAHGGEDVLKHKATRMKAQGKITLPGAGEVDFTQQTAYVLPDKFRDTVELSVGGKSITIFTLINGDKILVEVDGQEQAAPADRIKESIKDVAAMTEAFRLVPLLKDKKYELSLIGEDKVDGKKVVGVRVVAKGQNDISMYFDKETGLIAKVEFRTKDDSGNEVTEERVVSEYQKKDGVPIPKKLVVKRDGKAFIDAEVLELRYVEKIDDSEFKK